MKGHSPTNIKAKQDLILGQSAPFGMKSKIRGSHNKHDIGAIAHFWKKCIKQK